MRPPGHSAFSMLSSLCRPPACFGQSALSRMFGAPRPDDNLSASRRPPNSSVPYSLFDDVLATCCRPAVWYSLAVRGFPSHSAALWLTSPPGCLTPSRSPDALLDIRCPLCYSVSSEPLWCLSCKSECAGRPVLHGWIGAPQAKWRPSGHLALSCPSDTIRVLVGP